LNIFEKTENVRVLKHVEHYFSFKKNKEFISDIYKSTVLQ